jgi:hypothetical protein
VDEEVLRLDHLPVERPVLDLVLAEVLGVRRHRHGEEAEEYGEDDASAHGPSWPT